MIDYNPAHYRAEGSFGWEGAQIYCTQCTGEAANVYSLEPGWTQTMEDVINATRQHHDDHHEGK